MARHLPDSRRTRLVVLGASGHAKVIIDAAKKQGLYELAGIIVKSLDNMPRACLGVPVLGTDDSLESLVREHGIQAAVVAIGDNFVREQVAAFIQSRYPLLEFGTIVHPSAQIGEEVAIGRGSVVMAGAVVNTGTTIGEFCIVNSSASLDHDNTVESYASIAPGATTGGNVAIGRAAAICLGAHVLHGRCIGANSVVGAGSVVTNDVPTNAVAYGTPARVQRMRAVGDRYL